MKYCGNCGIELKDEDKFCPNCATEYIEYTPEIEKIQMQEKLDIKKRKKKKIKLTVLGAVIIAIAVIGVSVATQYDDLVASYNEAVDDIEKMNQEATQESGKNTTNNFEESTQEASTEENTTIQNETIELLDLFDSLETVKQTLGEETEEVKDVEAYQKHTFNEVSILCEYGTSNVYSVSVKYTSESAKNNYTVLDVNGNSTETDWDSAFGNLYYQGMDADGNSVSNYDTEYNGKWFDIEVTYSSNNPDMIRIWFVPDDMPNDE